MKKRKSILQLGSGEGSSRNQWEEYENQLLETRRIFYMEEEVDIPTAKPIVKQLLYLNDQDDDRPIDLFIDCYGGLEEGGNAIIDVMKWIDSPVNTYVIGTACSMAALISICGDYRYMFKRASWMMHDSSFQYDDYISKIKPRMEWDNKMTEMYHRIIAEETEMTPEDIELMIKGETWYSAVKALEKGVIDEIL